MNSSLPEDSRLDVDLAVVGFGKGGKTLTGAMAKLGKRVALIEQSPEMYGGTCINIGCVPTKALVHQAEHPDPRLDGASWFARAADRKTKLTTAMRAKNFELFDSPETSVVITGRARFTDPHSILVSAGPDRLLVHAAQIVINTGAEPDLPPIPGLADGKRVVTSTTMLAMNRLV